MPSPVEERPGLLIRDSFRYSDAVLIIPPPLVQALSCLDGKHTERDLRERLYEITGQLEVSQVADHLMEVLSQSGFLQDETFEQLREKRQRDFAESPVREPVHAGTAYPQDENELQSVMQRYMGNGSTPEEGALPFAIAAPHVSPEGGWESYRAAYGSLRPELKDRTFVILGTSHYGEPNRFGLTRKPFVTPFGTTRTASALVEELGTQPGAIMEDYCHAVEHSIEFQVVFLQHLFGPEITVLPVLCGSYGPSLLSGEAPEADPMVARFLDSLAEINARERDKLFWVLGIDMAHMGRRYGDDFAAIANEDQMAGVALRDRARIDSLNAGASENFWEQVQQNQDDLKWCGSSPVYTFLKAVPEARGKLRRYEQWNIDEQSVVSFAGITFHRAE